MLLVALVASIASTQAATPVDAGIDGGVIHARADTADSASAVAIRDSSLIEGKARMAMRRHVKRCKASNAASTQQKSVKHKDGKDNDGTDKKGKKDKKKSTKEDGKTSTKTQKSKSAKADDEDSPSGTDVIGKAKGLIGLTFGGQCSKPDASSKYPNGNIDFLNCGLSKSNPNGKWSPPNVKMSQLKFVSSSEATKSGVFGPCSKYKSAFDSAASKTGVPAVLLMAFAMQESTCNPSVKGGNGEIGMMQLTPDKCKNANCWDANTNVQMGAKYFKGQLDSFGGNVLEALGSYNGWQKGLTYSRATSTQYGCHAQNNLDYLNQMLNGWALGKDGHSLTVYNNLAKCGGD